VQVFRDLDALKPFPEGAVVTIGAYDGVHLGHRAVIGEVCRQAELLGARSVVVTFDRHPAEVVRPQSAPKLLTDSSQKLELLASTGVDATLIVPFDSTRSTEPAEHFVREVLVERLGVRHVVVGGDFHFGKDRRGNVAMLKLLGEEYGFTVDGLELIDCFGKVKLKPLRIYSDVTMRSAGLLLTVMRVAARWVSLLPMWRSRPKFVCRPMAFMPDGMFGHRARFCLPLSTWVDDQHFMTRSPIRCLRRS
jgi:cytidyltransferase-like protein